MAARTFHVSLVNRSFPFNFNELSSTIIYGSPLEQNRDAPQDFVGRDANLSYGICQAYFMQNVLPTVRGYSSLRFERMIPPNPRPMLNARQVIILRGEGNSVALLVVSEGSINIYDTQVGEWITTSLPVDKSTNVSSAYVKTKTYVSLGELGVYSYSFREKEFQLVDLKGISAPEIKGIVSGGDRMIAYSNSDIAWSSLLDPTDFTPSLDTGAGTTGVIAVRGEIVTVAGSGEDFIIYTASNAVYAAKSGNPTFPYKFNEIKGSEGIASAAHVTQDGNRDVQITWTASGFQEVGRDGAEYIWPELSQGIIRGQESVINGPTGYPEVLNHGAALDVRLGFVSNRWIAISVRTSISAVSGGSYSSAYIYDTLLSRWGKIDIPHYSLVQFTAPDFYIPVTYEDFATSYPYYQDVAGHQYKEWQVPFVSSAPVAGKNFGILMANGAIVRAALFEGMQDIDPNSLVEVKPSKLILGKFKIFRDQGAHMQWLKAQGVGDARKVVHSHDNTGNYIDSYDTFIVNPKQPGQFFRRMNADSFSVEFEGNFHLVDLSIHATDGGSINQRGQYIPSCWTIAVDGCPVTVEDWMDTGEVDEDGEPIVELGEYNLGWGRQCKYTEVPPAPEPKCIISVDSTEVWPIGYERDGQIFWAIIGQDEEIYNPASFVNNGQEFDISDGIAICINPLDRKIDWVEGWYDEEVASDRVMGNLSLVRGIPNEWDFNEFPNPDVSSIYNEYFELFVLWEYRLEYFSEVEEWPEATYINMDLRVTFNSSAMSDEFGDGVAIGNLSIDKLGKLIEYPKLIITGHSGHFRYYIDIDGTPTEFSMYNSKYVSAADMREFFSHPAKLLLREWSIPLPPS